MCKKMMYLVSFVLVLSLANSVANADLVAGYDFDGSFDDSSGNGFTGVPTAQNVGFSTNVPPGHVGRSLSLQLGGYVEIPLGSANPILDDSDGFTVMCWTLCDAGGEWPWPMVSSNGNVQQSDWFMGAEFEGNQISYFMDVWYVNAFGTELFDPALWHHVALVYEGGEQWTYYVDGEVAGTGSMLIGDDDRTNFLVRIGGGNNGDVPGVGGIYVGLLDDVGIFDTALTEEEIKQIMDTGIGIGPEYASAPNPADRATDVPRDVVLGWTPGDFANTHNVYLGTAFDDVNDAVLADAVSAGQTGTTYDPPGRLDFGQTYFWRIDEVNAPPHSTIFKGELWSFTTEPIGYPIDGANITATASSSMAGSSPQKTVDGSGLDDSDLHSVNLGDAWLSDLSGTQPTWIEYQFDKVYKLHEMWVWNQNQIIESAIGYGFKDVSIEYSVDGIAYTTLGTTHEFARGSAAPGYAANTTVDFEGVAAKYVKLTANTNWGGILAQYGLSEVRFFNIPVLAKEPSPASGATDVGVEATLAWRAGREADKHDVYVSTDEQAVIDGTGPVVTVTDASYSASLDMGSTYYWRIDEVNDAETPTTWQGDVWNFTTPEYLVVDDFESYNDIEAGQEGSNLVYETWIDGYANPSVNGSTMGYTVAFQPSLETSAVYDGEQSAPLFYDNTTAGYSEITANVADLQAVRDWTRHGIKVLTVWFKGNLSHAATDQLYVKINGTKVVYDGDLTTPLWKPFSVGLASLGINLSNVTTLSIGVDGSSSGMLLVDGIRLYKTAPPVAGPAPGGDPSLVGHWKLDETSGLTAADSSGYGNHGTLKNWDRTLMDTATADAGWVAGIKDGARFLESGQYVDFGNDKSLQLTGQVTVSAWVKMDPANADGAYMGIGGKIVSDPYNGYELVRHSSNVFRMWLGNDGGDLSSVDSDATYTDTDWHHVVGVISNNTGYLYVDGVKQTAETACGLVDTGDFAYIGRHYSNGNDDRYWTGTIDDFRIYYRALSAAEIAGL